MEVHDTPDADLPDFDNRYFRGYQIYTSPNRPGYLPIGRTQFYEHLKSGRFPKPDGYIGAAPVWLGRSIREAMSVK